MRGGSGRGFVLAATVVLVAVGLAGCGGGDGDGDAATRQVRVDYSSDEFGSFALQNFPEKVSVRPGDTIEFKQTWTGEPHTVTGGSSVSKIVVAGSAWIDFFEAYESLLSMGAVPNAEDPGDATVGDVAKAIAAAKDT